MKIKRIISRVDFEITKLRLSSFRTSQKSGTLGYSPKEHINRVAELREKYRSNSSERVLFLSDSFEVSPGGFSALMNLSNGLHLIGSEVILSTDLNSDRCLDFRPTIIIFSDTPSQLKFIMAHKTTIAEMNIKLGISLITKADMKSVDKENQFVKYNDFGVDFFWGWKNPSFYKNDDYTQEIVNVTKKIVLSLEFSADLLSLAPVFKNRENVDYDFVFLASRNLDKWSTLMPALLKLKKYGFTGCVNGPGWNSRQDIVTKPEHTKLYNNTRLGLNLHIPMSRDEKTELNERFYNLILSGVPQVVDKISLIEEYGFLDTVYTFDTYDDMLEKCNFVCENQLIALENALSGYNKIMASHTNIHRANKLLLDLELIQ